MYTIPIVNGALDLENAVRDPEEGFMHDIKHGSFDYNITESDTAPGLCVPQFPTRKTRCRARTIRRADYVRAFAQYLNWVESGPDDGWIPRKSCKSLVYGLVVVSACSTGGPNPTCRDEVVEAMRELDVYCNEDAGGDIIIKKWKKIYNRHNIRDGDGLDGLLLASAEDDEEPETGIDAE